MNRQRRRRVTVNAEDSAQKQLPSDTHNFSEGKVMFMEEVDYKMEEVH